MQKWMEFLCDKSEHALAYEQFRSVSVYKEGREEQAVPLIALLEALKAKAA